MRILHLLIAMLNVRQSYHPVGTTCSCPTGQFMQGSGCTPCNSACSSCTGPSINQCSGCNSPYTISGSTCQCINRVYASSPGICSSCHYSCLTCDGSLSADCLSCDPADNRTKSGSRCPCDVTFLEIGVQQDGTGTCVEICGDGLKFDFQCDDGNTADGDRCSSVCTVEAN